MIKQLGSLNEVIEFLNSEEKQLREKMLCAYENCEGLKICAKLEGKLEYVCKLKKMIVIKGVAVDTVLIEDLQEHLDEEEIDATATIEHARSIARMINRIHSKSSEAWFYVMREWIEEMKEAADG